MIKLKYLLHICLYLLLAKVSAQKAEVIKLPHLQQLLSSNTDTTYVLNFMATWCKPCMEELPHFEKVSAENHQQKVKFIYISLDAASDLDKKLNKLIERKNIKNKVYLLDEPDYNSWLDKIEKSWDGVIPVTFVVNNAKNIRLFIPKPFTYEELAALVKQNTF